MKNKEIAGKALSCLDDTASYLEKLVKAKKIDPKLASRLVSELDSFADRLQVATFGEESLRNYQAKVIRQDKDESYMKTFDNPNKVLKSDPDETYMHKTGPSFNGKSVDTFDCDQSSAVADRPEYNVRDESEYGDGTKKQPSWKSGPAGKSTRQGSKQPSKSWALS